MINCGSMLYVLGNFVGLALAVLILFKSADIFTDAAVEIATRLRMSHVVIGATIVSFATTLPEFSLSLLATIHNEIDVAVGNAVGSTICNVGLILGICAAIAPMQIERAAFINAGSVLLVLGLLFGMLGLLLPDGSRFIGLVMISFLGIYLASSVVSSLNQRRRTAHDPIEDVTATRHRSAFVVALIFLIAALGIAAGTQFMLWCGQNIAEAFSIPPLIIGLTLFAVGTSTPEFIVSLTAILKRRRGISVGNIIGANILNLAWVIGLCSLVRPLPFQVQTRFYDIPVMLLLSVLLLVFGLTGERLARWEGITLLGVYVAYVAVMFVFFRTPAAVL
jgi:cation:H+ antiporter